MIIWTPYFKQELTVGKKLVQRKDGKIHLEMYNGTGFAYNNNVIVAYSEINKHSTTKTKAYDYLKGIEDAFETNDCCCPNCRKEPSHNLPYNVDNIYYPIILDEEKNFSHLGYFMSWTKLHKCVECRTLFYFKERN